MPKLKWEIANSIDKEYIFELARSKGWLENKVQVKRYKGIKEDWWILEPYEENCNCPGIVTPF